MVVKIEILLKIGKENINRNSEDRNMNRKILQIGKKIEKRASGSEQFGKIVAKQSLGGKNRRESGRGTTMVVKNVIHNVK